MDILDKFQITLFDKKFQLFKTLSIKIKKKKIQIVFF